MGINANTSGSVNQSAQNKAFLKRVYEEVEANLRNEQFSVAELAGRMNMSRSHLHRKLKQTTGQSINQLVREYRLQRAMEILKKEDKTVSEVAYEVGFGSPSYFTSCFTEYYGYPPGEARYRSVESAGQNNAGEQEAVKLHGRRRKTIVTGLIILALTAAFLLYRQLGAGPNPEAAIIAPNDLSIAVLPFKNLNKDQENEYFGEGIVEAVNRQLSRMNDLRVISLTSTDRYRKGGKSAQEIGNELKVSNLLEGSIQRYENIVRIEVRLVDTGTEEQIWAENYDRELKDILRTQSEIAEKVALALKAELSPEERAALGQITTDNPQAYDLYLKGRYEYRTYTRNGLHRAIDYFKKAITLDSAYASAYAGLAAAYMAKASIFGTELGALEAMSMAKPAIDKSLALDPELAWAHLMNGFYLLYNNWDFEGAEREYKQAIITNDPDALAVYADFLNFVRRHQEALEISERLHQTNPYYPNSRMILTLYYLGRYEEAAEFAKSRTVLFNNYLTLDNYGFLMLNTGNYPKAIELFRKALEIEDIRYPRVLGWMAAAYARSGHEGKAVEILEELKARKTKTDAGSLSFFIAVIYAALDDRAAALQWLQKAYDLHEMEIPWLKSEPQFYSLHEEPAFQDLLDKVGFP